MDLRKILFIGGDAARLASVQIRCVDIAGRLGCQQALKLQSLDEIPRSYSAFVCVKSLLDPLHLRKLQKRGVVIWDVIDALPPKAGVDIYLTSSAGIRDSLAGYGRVEMIRHHHCNERAVPNRPANRRPGWIGGRHWAPAIPGLKFDKYWVEGMRRNEVVQALRRIGIGLNLRAGDGAWPNPRHPEKLFYDFHVALNSGIKLINCFGFGIPSISGDEPAYREIDEDCTIFATAANCAEWVKELKRNDTLYRRLRKNCLRQAKKFHLNAIAAEYKRLLQSL